MPLLNIFGRKRDRKYSPTPSPSPSPSESASWSISPSPSYSYSPSATASISISASPSAAYIEREPDIARYKKRTPDYGCQGRCAYCGCKTYYNEKVCSRCGAPQ